MSDYDLIRFGAVGNMHGGGGGGGTEKILMNKFLGGAGG